MIAKPVLLAIGRFEERVVTGAKGVCLRRFRKYRMWHFLPGSWIEEITAAGGDEHTEGIMVGPAAASRVRKEKLVAVFKNLRTLVHVDVSGGRRKIADLFPWELRSGNEDTVSLDSPRIREFGKVDVLRTIDIARPPGPGEVEMAMIREDSGIDGPFICGIGDLAAHDPCAFERIGGTVFDNVDAVRLIASRVRSEIDVPVAVQVVKFRSPDLVRVRTGGRRRSNDLGFGVCRDR